MNSSERNMPYNWAWRLKVPELAIEDVGGPGQSMAATSSHRRRGCAAGCRAATTAQKDARQWNSRSTAFGRGLGKLVMVFLAKSKLRGVKLRPAALLHLAPAEMKPGTRTSSPLARLGPCTTVAAASRS